MTQYAPIAVFAYRRARGLALTLDALERCPEYAQSRVYVFSDGASNERARRDVEDVRKVLHQRKTPNMTVFESPQNKGLARSIIEGVTQLCDEHGRVIVMEDDLIASPVMLTWMNQALDAYQDDAQVMQVSAHTHRDPEFVQRSHGHFLPFTTTWGWATWKRAWDKFDTHASGWEELASNAELSHAFDLNGAYPYAQMMRNQMDGRADSWGIRWYWSVFRNQGLVLFPPETMIFNRGADTKATHGMKSLFLANLRPNVRKLRRTLPDLPQSVSMRPEDLAIASRAIRARRF